MIRACQQATESSMNLINFANSIKLNSISGIVISNKRWRLTFSRSKINARLWLIPASKRGFDQIRYTTNREEILHRKAKGETARPRIPYSTNTEYLTKRHPSSAPDDLPPSRWKRKEIHGADDWTRAKNRAKKNSSIRISLSRTR